MIPDKQPSNSFVTVGQIFETYRFKKKTTDTEGKTVICNSMQSGCSHIAKAVINI